MGNKSIIDGSFGQNGLVEWHSLEVETLIINLGSFAKILFWFKNKIRSRF